MKRYFLALGMMLAAMFALGLPAAAQDVAQAAPAPSPSPSASPSPKPFQMSGYLDVGYQSASVSSPAQVISGRVFDTVSGTPQLHNLNLQASYTGPIGAKVELSIGDDAEYLHSYPQILRAFGSPPYPPTTPSLFTYGPGISSKVDLTQAYASGTLGPVTLIAGKFATLAGAEVLESPSDLNYSRSILFGFAIPFTHTGVRLTWAAAPTLSLIGGINRGWDITKTLPASQNGSGGVAADNTSITAEYGVAWNPVKAFSLNAQGYSGKVANWAFVGCANTNCVRNLVDVVGTYHINDAWTITANADFGSQSNTALPGFVAGLPATVSQTATWKGFAGYVSNALNSRLTAALRYEVFADYQGYRIGNLVGTRWTEGTATVSYAATPNLTLRLEGRNDNASQPIFASKIGTQKTNTSVGFEAILHAP